MAPALRMTRSIKEKLQIFLNFSFEECIHLTQKALGSITIVDVLEGRLLILVLGTPDARDALPGERTDASNTKASGSAAESPSCSYEACRQISSKNRHRID